MKPAQCNPAKEDQAPHAEPAGVAQSHTIDSRMLLKGRDTIDIAHHGELYRLRLTRQGKLILTK